MKQETKTRTLVALRIVGAALKRFKGPIMSGVFLVLCFALILPWVDMFHEIEEITTDDETLTKLVSFVEYSMAVMILPAALGIQAMLRKK